MSHITEQEVQLQFLEEAQDYLNDIEAGLLGTAHQTVQLAQMDTLLRAAHSIKGGAALMGFEILSDLAHKIEDAFKVLRTQRDLVDPELEQMLLQAVDGMRKVIFHNRRGVPIDRNWLRSSVMITFNGLHRRLGDPLPEDETSLMADEAGADMVSLLFESEVDGCLERLEGVLNHPERPCLAEEVAIAAQELSGLAAMLDLPAFGLLCQSVSDALTEADAEAQKNRIAELAIAEWRRVQAMVMIGQTNAIPLALDISDLSAEVSQPSATHTLEEIATTLDDWSASEGIEHPDQVLSSNLDSAELELSDLKLPELEAAELDDFDLRDDESVALADELGLTELADVGMTDAIALAPEDSQDQHSNQTDFDVALDLPVLDGADLDEFDLSQEALTAIADDLQLDLEAMASPLTEKVTVAESDAEVEAIAAEEADSSLLDDAIPATDENGEVNKPPGLDGTDAAPETVAAQTIRVSVPKLQQLGEQFGELVIERNGLVQELGQMRSLMNRLNERVQSLHQANHQLRTAYDQIAVQLPSQGPGSLNPPISPTPTHTPSDAFDALEMDRYGNLHLISQELMETAIQIQEVTSDVNLHLEEAEQTTRDLSRTTKQLQASMTQIRMRPISDLLNRLPRMLRELELQYGKSVTLAFKGGGTLIDRTILEALNDPLIHLVRNAFDHGIEAIATRQEHGKPETGTIEITAAYRGNQTIITVQDDGGGIALDKVKARALKLGVPAEQLEQASDTELLELLFEPGFSTADTVTSLSGRGVGMDVVRHNLQQLRGDISIQTTPGQGTTFTMTVPFTLSVVRSLLVESQRTLLAFPTDSIEEIAILQPDAVSQEQGQRIFHWEGEQIPLLALEEFLQFPFTPPIQDIESSPLINQPLVMLVEQNGQAVGIQVDRYWGEQEVTIRQVEGSLPMPHGFAGCTILGDGRIAPLMDVMALVNHLQMSARASQNETSETQPAQFHAPEGFDSNSVPVVLVVDDSVNVRRFLAMTVEKSGYRVEQARDGQHALDVLQAEPSVQAVICDLEMPRLDGFGFLSHVKSDPALKQIPVMMLTSRSGQKHRKLAQTLGAAAYFCKPFKERELLDSLAQVIAA